jgi:hypothetical protein
MTVTGGIRLACAIAAVSLAAPAGAGAVGWGTPVPLTGATGSVSTGSGGRQPHLLFDAVGSVTAWWGQPVGVATSADGGASWLSPFTPPGLPDLLAAGSDPRGGRVYAWPVSSGVRVMRTAPTGAPVGNGYATIQLGAASANGLSVAVNASGDALIAYTSLQGGTFTNGQGGATFWPAGQAAPNAGQWIASSQSSSFAPTAVLDDDRYAVVAWQLDQSVQQSIAADASGTNPFAAPATLGAGGQPMGAEAPGGRAVIAWEENVLVPSPDPGFANNFTRVVGATRAPGKPFGSGQVIDGSPHSYIVRAPGSVAISPTGRFVVGYAANVNRSVSMTCKDIRGEWESRAATGTVDVNGGASFAPQTLAGGGTINAFQPYVGAGPDGRLMASWNQIEDCGVNNDGINATQRPGVAFAPPAGGFATVAQPPGWVGALGFRNDGTGYVIETAAPVSSGPLLGVPYDTGVPLVAPGAPAGPVPPVVPTPPTPPGTSVGVSPPKFVSATPLPDGALRLTFTSDPGELAFRALARRGGLLARAPKLVQVASAKVKVKRRGRVSVVLRATGRGARTLKRRGSLAATLQTTFKPAAGGKALVTTRGVTFSKAKRKARR